MKKVKTQAEIDQREAEKKRKRNHVSATTKAKNIMKNLCIKTDLRTAQAQLEYAKSNPQQLPKIKVGLAELSQPEILSAYQLGMDEYLEGKQLIK